MYDFKFADIGEGIHEGKILKWNFKVGDKVKEGETLVIVETDKVNAELPSPVDGVIEKLGAAEGDTIHVGQTVVLINDGSETPVKKEEPKSEPKEEVKEEPKKEPISEGKAAPGVIGQIEVSEDVMESSAEGSSQKKEEKVSSKVLATPVARQLAKDLNVDINQVIGSGEHGRVMKEDIEKAAKGSKQETTYAQPKVSISVQGEVEYVPITKLRKAIVNAMTRAKQIIPHTVLMDEVVVDKLVDLRKKVKDQAAAQDIKLTYMAFIMKATVLALKKFPYFNASFDQENERMVLKKFINLGMAVDTPDGLIVPNIKDADHKSILELAKELREVADQTIERKVQLSQLQNTTFSITNFGAADVRYGTPIINHPEVGILGIGRIEQKAVVENGEIVVRYVMPLSLAVDHRVIDGADAGRFLSYIKTLLNDPMMLLLS
ncbi:MAG: dihydrolipoamide acetyltransferase family protein [Acholeplasmataceae bacterium]|jgi:pyruvate dehydrogenase E2 component (dihydrolipoamide acetyltransferase)|nr:dihydrolipoamide acetyltransferase family protein [Acholeplasmataceae bacterium]